MTIYKPENKQFAATRFFKCVSRQTNNSMPCSKQAYNMHLIANRLEGTDDGWTNGAFLLSGTAGLAGRRDSRRAAGGSCV